MANRRTVHQIRDRGGNNRTQCRLHERLEGRRGGRVRPVRTGESTTPGTGTGTTTKSGGGETVNFILTPAESSVDIQEQYKPLFSYLEEEGERDCRVRDGRRRLRRRAAGTEERAGRHRRRPAPAIAIIRAANEDVTNVVGIRIGARCLALTSRSSRRRQTAASSPASRRPRRRDGCLRRPPLDEWVAVPALHAQARPVSTRVVPPTVSPRTSPASGR